MEYMEWNGMYGMEWNGIYGMKWNGMLLYRGKIKRDLKTTI